MKVQLTMLTVGLSFWLFASCSKNALNPSQNQGGKSAQHLSAFSSTGLTVYQNPNQTAPSADLQVGVIYEGAGATGSGYQALPSGFDNTIQSFDVPQGYMVTFAENVDGTGESITYVAAVSSLHQNLPSRLINKVSFVRYIPLENITKKGTAYIDTNVIAVLNADWFYYWADSVKYHNTPHEFVPMTWGKKTASADIANYFIGLQGIDHILSFNEPDNVNQSNIPVDTAVNRYKVMLSTGLRLGAPAVQQGNAFGAGKWLTLFMSGAAAQKERVDFIPIHWYDWGNQTQTLATDSLTANAVLNRFKTYITNVHNAYPAQMIWITEFNANPNRTSSNVHEIFMRNAAAWLNAQPYVERYSYFFPNALPPTTGPTGNYALTSIGTAWKNIVSPPAYAANIVPN
ncbi:MAG: glycosyl hydrolase [Mucilaginibacter sp.]